MHMQLICHANSFSLKCTHCTNDTIHNAHILKQKCTYTKPKMHNIYSKMHNVPCLYSKIQSYENKEIRDINIKFGF